MDYPLPPPPVSLDHSQVQGQINENSTITTMGVPPVPQPDITPSITTTISTTSTTGGFVDTHPVVVTKTETEEEALQKKRTALAGQWRTPPTPFFTSGNGTSNIHVGTSSIDSNSTSYDSSNIVTTTVASLPTSTTGTTVAVAVVPPILLEDDDVMAAPPTSLPHSAEDYAKALQEAYRRGAEAAARAAAVAVQQQPPPPMVHVASCPDLVPLATTTTTDIPPTLPMMNMGMTSSTSSIHPMSMSAPAAASSSSSSTAVSTLLNTASTGLVADPTTYTVPVQESPSPPQQQQQPMQVQVVHHHHHHHILPAPPNNHNSTTPSVDTTDVGSVKMMIPTTSPSTMMPSSSSSTVAVPMNTDAPNMVISSHPPPATTLHQPSTDMTGITAATTTTSLSPSNPNTIPTPMVTTSTTSKQQQQQQQQQRSVSLPDMSSYAAQQEDEKRQKRLARNRASARLRRLRKKNLVDAYEVEVGHLEKTMAQLQQHEWGCTNSSHTTGVQSATVLAEALSMDRGQQKLSVAERNKAATDILQQQLQFLQQLEDLMQEQYVLQQVAQFTLNGSGNESMNEWKDLQDTLQLSPDQCQQIMDQSTGWDDEWQALQTVKSSLIAMRDNDWLWNEGCASITDQFMSILHSNQISKLLLWADHNAETIEELDSVHAINIVPNTPVFQFGMDNNPNEYMDDERMAA